MRIRELYSRYFSYYYNKDHEKTSNAIWLKLNEWKQVNQNDDVEIKIRYNGTKTRFLTCIICRFGFLMLIWLGFCDAIPYNNCKEWYKYKVTQHRSEDYQISCVAVLCNCFMSTRKKKLQKYDRNDQLVIKIDIRLHLY